MGCICGKPLVKSSIEKATENKISNFNEESSTTSLKIKDNLPSDASNGSINQKKPPESLLPKPIKVKSSLCIRKEPETYDFYSFSPEIAIEVERSHSSDWHQLIQVHFSSIDPSLKPCNSTNDVLKNDWDVNSTLELTKKILILPARHWINEQIYLMNQTLQKTTDTGANFNRKSIQLKYQFQWLIWAVGTYFYIYISGKSKKIGTEFEKFTGVKVLLPETKPEWLEGFVYKSVRFQLFYLASPQAKAFKAEVKAMKLLYLENQCTTHGLVFPLLTYMKIGTFLLSAVPVYPTTFLYPCNDLYFDLFSKSNFCIPSSSAYKLKVDGDIYLIYNGSMFVPNQETQQYVGVFSTTKDEVSIFEAHSQGRVTKNQVIKYLYGKSVRNLKITKEFNSAYGWDCFVFWDPASENQSKHSFSDHFGGVLGDFVVYFYSQGKSYRRFPVVSLDSHELTQSLHAGIRECINSLEYSESISTQESLTELMHRKGLNSYHKWLIYSRCRSERTNTLLECALLCKAIKALISSHIYEKQQMKAKSLKRQLCRVLKALLKPFCCGPEATPKLGFVLFLQRLRCVQASSVAASSADRSMSRVIDPQGQMMHSQQYLTSSEMINRVLSVGCRSPKELLQAVEYYFDLSMDPLAFSKATNDKYTFLEAPEVISNSHFSKLKLSIFSITSLREDSYLLFLAISDKTFFGESSISSIEESQIYLLPKENEFNSLSMILPGDLYSYNNKIFKENYSLPSITLMKEWAHVQESLYKDLITPTGQEAVVVEIYLLICSILIAKDKNSEGCLSVLVKAIKAIEGCAVISPDIVIGYYMWNGICQEYHHVSVAEQSYITALLLMIRAYGDPRGRGSIGIPWQMISAWKLSKIAREEKRVHDAQLAEEFFDSVFMNSNEFKQTQKKFNRKYSKQQASIYKNPFETSTEPQWDEILAWLSNTSPVSFSSSLIWSHAELHDNIRTTQILQFPTQHSQILNTSGASTPSSYKDTKRGLQQSSLSQALMMQSTALHPESMVGVIYAWGTDSDGQLGIYNGRDSPKVLIFPRMLTCLKDVVITEVAAGALHCLAVSLDGLCYAWGNNEGFQLGLGPDTPAHVAQPVLIKAVSHIKKAACGYQHSLLLNEDNNLLTMGLGEGGVLGHGNSNSVMYPKLVQTLKNLYVAKIEAGGYHSLAVTNEGHVYVWGRGEGGQLGIDREQLPVVNGEICVESPTRVLHALAQKRVMQVACGEAHCLALTNEGTVFAWGWGSNGQLGNGYREEDFMEAGNQMSIQYVPSLIQAFTQPIKQISAGGLFSMFLTEEDEVYICGANDKRQLGLESEVRDVAIPTRIDCFVGYPVSHIACGESHCIAVAEKLVWSWGNYREYQLGLGEMTASTMPRPMQSLTNAVISRAACGRVHSLVVVGTTGKSIKRTETVPINWKISFQ